MHLSSVPTSFNSSSMSAFVLDCEVERFLSDHVVSVYAYCVCYIVTFVCFVWILKFYKTF